MIKCQKKSLNTIKYIENEMYRNKKRDVGETTNL